MLCIPAEALPVQGPGATPEHAHQCPHGQLCAAFLQKYRTGGGSLEQLLADCIKGMYYAGSLGSNWAWDLRQHLLSSGRFSEIRTSALAEMNTGQEPLDMPLSVAMRWAGQHHLLSSCT